MKLQEHTAEFMPSGLKIEGPFENKRNKDSSELLHKIIKRVYGATECIVAHHITYVAVDHQDGYELQVVEEIPSIDTLIFDHEVAKKLWGARWRDVLMELALMPVSERDTVLRVHYDNFYPDDAVGA